MGTPMATTIPQSLIGIIVTSVYQPYLLAVTGRYTLAGTCAVYRSEGNHGPVRINDRLQ
jgi:hypothetical protein